MGLDKTQRRLSRDTRARIFFSPFFYFPFFFFFFVYHDDHGLAIRYNYKTNQTTYNWDTQLLKVYTNSLDERPG